MVRKRAAQTGLHNAKDGVAISYLLQMRLQAAPTFGVASSVCHSERSSLLKAAPLPLPSRSLAAHFLLEPKESLFYWLPTKFEREPYFPILTITIVVFSVAHTPF